MFTIYIFSALLIGITLGVVVFYKYNKRKISSYQLLADELKTNSLKEIEQYRKEQELLIEKQQIQYHKKVEDLLQNEKQKINQYKEELKQKELKIDQRYANLEKSLLSIEKKEGSLIKKEETSQDKLANIKRQEIELLKQLESLADLTKKEAKNIIREYSKKELEQERAELIKKSYTEATIESEKEASKIISTAISRLAVPSSTENTMTVFSLEDDRMKGRIIGKEGRNIRALEEISGANFIMDDKTNTILISSFDPQRKEIAKNTLKALIADGRIHPSRIEEIFQQEEKKLERSIIQFGQEAALKAGAAGMHHDIIKLLGSLQYRYSWGQNLLAHSIEVSSLMGIMAAELKLNESLARRIGLLHDIGKAVNHNITGSHAQIGYKIAQKYGEHDDVSHGILSHHEEVPPRTPEASLCLSADAISASRTGARIEALEYYVKRLKNLEDIAHRFPGVDKAFALHAGRELRVSIIPEMIDDYGSTVLARDIAKTIEKEVSFSGRIKVSIIREKRSIEYAL